MSPKKIKRINMNIEKLKPQNQNGKNKSSRSYPAKLHISQYFTRRKLNPPIQPLIYIFQLPRWRSYYASQEIPCGMFLEENFFRFDLECENRSIYKKKKKSLEIFKK